MGTRQDYEFLFVVDGVTVDNDSAVTTITDTFDGILSCSRGLHRLAISGPGANAIGAFRDLRDRLRQAIPALRILRSDPDLVGVSDIAERTNHSRQNVQQWVNGERNATRPFPSPEGSVGRSLAWRWAEVNEWLRPLGLDDQSPRPTRDECVFIDAELITALIASKASRQAQQQIATLTGSLQDYLDTGEPRSRASVSQHSAEAHQALIARIPVITGVGLDGWFTRVESGPAFPRLQERADWLADEHGLANSIAVAIVTEYERRQRLRGEKISDSVASKPAR